MKPNDGSKTLTLKMQGFPEVVNALGGVPGAVKFAGRKIERGDVAGGSEVLVAALAKLELAKGVILSNLAFASMQAGDIGQATGYVEIALESLAELGMEDTEVAGMLKVAYACLPAEFKSEDLAAADAEAAAEQDAGGTDGDTSFDDALKGAVTLLMSAPAPSGKDGEKPVVGVGSVAQPVVGVQEDATRVVTGDATSSEKTGD